MSRLAAACVVCLIALCAATATAADEPRTDGTSVVHVYVSGTPGALAKTAATVRELCARLNIDVVVEAAADESVLDKAEPRTWLRAFVDLRAPSTPHVVVVEAATHRELERRNLPNSSSLEMSVEESAHVVYVAAESALAARETRTAGSESSAPAPSEAPRSAEGASTGPVDAKSPESARDHAPPERAQPHPAVEREAMRAAEKKDSAAPAPHTRAPSFARFQTAASVYGAVAAFDPSHALAGFGGSLDGGVKSGAFRISALASMSAFLPSEVTSAGASAMLHAEGARLSAVVEWDATSAFGPFVSVGGGADRVTVDPNPPPGAWSAGSESRVDPMIEALLGAKLRFTRVVGAFFAFGTDADLAPHRYVIEANGAPQTFFDLARVRPTAMLGLSILLTGAPSAAARGPGGASP